MVKQFDEEDYEYYRLEMYNAEDVASNGLQSNFLGGKYEKIC